MHRRQFLQKSAASLLFATVGSSLSANVLSHRPLSAPLDVFLDCDTANEVDDLFAIVRALLIDDWTIHGLASTQWEHHLAPENTVRESQELNELLLRLMNRMDIPAPLGAGMIMGKPWGGYEARDSPAARMLIRAALAMPEGRRLTVVATGAGTNVASAIKLAPEIIPKVSVYQLGARYHADTKVWNKDEFNIRRDLNAFNFLLNREGLDYHVMPVNTLFDFTFRLSDTVERLSSKGPVWDLLAARWLSHSPDAESRIIWDLALIDALYRPDWATEQKVMAPPENTQREIWVYTDIDEEKMIADWWRTVEENSQG